MGQVSHGSYAESVNELVCLDMPCGPGMVERIKRAWDEGDAVFPLDQRLPAPARDAVLAVVRPTMVNDGSSDVRVEGDPVEPGDAVVVATSGTTGAPKGVVLTHGAVGASARATSSRLGITASDTWLACLPPAHVGGLSVILRSIVTGTPVIAVDGFSNDNYVSAARQGATLVSLVATALRRVDASLYRTIVLGGARPPGDRPANVVTTYGMTETGSGVVYDGRPLDGVEVRIVDGVVHLRCPMLLRSYRGGPSPLSADGWFRTGDIGTFEDGVLTVDGREGDLIITGGENVWPEQVEEVLRTHPGLADVCVAGVDDPEWGRAVHAWVVPKNDDSPSLDELRDHVKSTLPSHCAPREVHVVDSIPRTNLGKPRRAALVDSLSDRN